MVVVGANAAAMEAIYTLRHDRGLLTALDVVIVITPSGSLPDGEASRRVQPAFVPPRLKQLDPHAAGLTADRVLAGTLPVTNDESR